MREPDHERRVIAALDLVGRTGASGTQIRYSEDPAPTVWLALAEYGDRRWEVAAGHDPVEAAERLAEVLVDGGLCKHCSRATAIALPGHDPLPGSGLCWYVLDVEAATYRRSCA